MFNNKDLIGWLGSVAVYRSADGGRWLVDMKGKKMFVKGGAE